LSLLYPSEEIESYSRESFLEDLINEAEADIRRCLDGEAHTVQIDFTDERLSVKLDPSKALLKNFVDLNNLVLDRFSSEEQGRATGPGYWTL
jgi:5-methyltetrahydropteroyltriglutamate--homocysteine methyltransferase